jgi:hypothetical protein
VRPAAVIVVALVLLASVVTGREGEPARSVEPVRSEPAPTLDLSRLARERGVQPIQEIFAVPAPPAPPPAVKAAPPPPPSAPPLPFAYLGRMKKGERITLYLLRSQEMVILEEGATLEGLYRLDRISETGAHFVYLPLGTEQTLAIPPAP